MKTGMAVLTICVAASLRAAGPDTVLLRGATVHPVSGPDIADGSVLVRDGKIAEVGARIAVPKGARIVELKGLHIYPGMIDSDTAIGLTEIEAVREMSDLSDIGLFKPQLRAAGHPRQRHHQRHYQPRRRHHRGPVRSDAPQRLDHGGYGCARARRHAPGISEHSHA
jgi:hypothetical protein